MRNPILSVAAIAVWLAIGQNLARSGTYPKLVPTQYDLRARLPDRARRPAVVLDEVDKSNLPGGVKVSATARSASGQIWLLTDQGAFRLTPTAFEPLVERPRPLERGQPAFNDKPRVKALVFDQLGHMWDGTKKGNFITNGEEWWHKLDGHDGVPFERINCLHLAINGDVWAGRPEGAWRLSDGQFRYLWGKRWLLDNDVQAIWTDEAGRVWIETKADVAGIVEMPMTLDCKARTKTRSSRRATIAAASSPTLTCKRRMM
jgi:ligand-binding sensor domain-containing protein